MTEPHSILTGIRKVHVVFKSHLDIGFTDLSSTVLNQYLEHDLPHALKLATDLNQAGDKKRFVWTVSAYLIDLALRTYPDDRRNQLLAALIRGDITYHALPFTMHSELCDGNLFRAGLAIAARLDHRLGRRTIAAKMSDVPGHTRGIIKPLRESGIEFLHIGINDVSRMPEVPAVFVWEDSQGNRAIVNYCRSYGQPTEIAGHDEVLYFVHSSDNAGLPDRTEIEKAYTEIGRRYPGASASGSTLDAFAESLRPLYEIFPVIRSEIGDTWIHGIASDPAKVALLRALQRQCRQWDQANSWAGLGDIRDRFLEGLLLVTEHTWGLDTKKFLPDYVNWDKDLFILARQQNRDRCDFFEGSHAEQRQYLEKAITCLPEPLKSEWQVQQGNPVLNESETANPEFVMPAALLQPDWQKGLPLFSGISPTDGPIIIQAVEYHRIGLSVYHHLSRTTLYRLDRHAEWAIPDFLKPGLENSNQPTLTAVSKPIDWHVRSVEASQIHYQAAFEDEPVLKAGCPRNIALSLTRVSPDSWMLELTLSQKSASRQPEAIFLPITGPKDARLRIRKIDEWIDPLDVMDGGNQRYHAVDRFQWTMMDGTSYEIEPLDSPLLVIGAPLLLDFSKPQPDELNQIYVNLYNNCWGTNFKMWYEEDITARFLIKQKIL